MSAYVCTYTTRQLAALALAVGLALGLGFVDQSIGRSSRDTSAALPPEGTAPEISGIARVIDGDTIHIGESRIRLEGIDAPEEAQTCARATGESWPCGRAATSEMQRMAHGRHVTCRHLGFDKYNRVLGACRQGDLDLNAEMVRRGMAWAYVRYSVAYVPLEAEARKARHGVWQGEAMAPWDFRAQRWTAAATTTAEVAPNGCVIKGNVTANGRIYHMPWSPWYAQIRMEGHKDRRWFCDENEAVAAGWRPAYTR